MDAEKILEIVNQIQDNLDEIEKEMGLCCQIKGRFILFNF